MSAEELANLRALLAASPPPENPTIEILRERFEKLAEFLPCPVGTEIETRPVGGVPAEIVSAPDVGEGRWILYLHGGGYVIGSPNTHRTLAANLSAAAGARVAVIDYRLAPEHPFPAALEDAVAAWTGLLADEGADPAHSAIAGDSAGGGLTVACLLKLRDAGAPLPACGLAISPWVDMEGTGASMSEKADVDPMVRKEGLLAFAGLYLAGADPREPLAAPLYADLAGLPPLMIQVGTAETLLDDSRRLAERAEAAGVAVELEVAEDMVHVWHLFAPMLSEGREAIGRAGAWLDARL